MNSCTFFTNILIFKYLEYRIAQENTWLMRHNIRECSVKLVRLSKTGNNINNGFMLISNRYFYMFLELKKLLNGYRGREVKKLIHHEGSVRLHVSWLPKISTIMAGTSSKST